MQLSAFDWLIIAGYLVITLSIGLLFRKRAGQSLADYFISGRSLPWWIAGTSMVATTFAADTPLAVTGLVAKHGLAGNWVWWSFALGGMLTVFVYARLWRRAEVMTDVELVELRYGGAPAAWLRGTRAIYVAMIINPIIIGWVTKAMVSVLKETVLFEYSTDLLPNFLPADAVIIGGLLAVVGVYCSLSGMWGVAITDFVQFFAAMLGCVLLAVFAVQHVGGIDALQTSVVSQFEDGQQAFSFLPVGNWMPLHIFCIFLFVQWWATWYPGAEPGGGGYVVQRMAACKDEKHAVFATLWYQIAHYCIRPWPWLMVAFVSIALFPEIRELATNEAFSKAQNKTADVGYAYVMRGEWNPNGLRGLMLVTFFAAFMSTISTQMNWGASYLVRDVYQRFINPHAEEKKLTQVSRWVSLFVLVVGGFVSGWMIASNQSIDDAWKLLLALGAGTGAVYMLRWFWWRINAWSEISAMVGSLVYFVLINQFCFRLDADGNKVAMFSGEETMLCVALLTIGTWLMVTFLTAPERQETLESFYRKVKPGGFGWQPFARLAPEVAVDRNLVLSIVTAVVASGIVFFTLPAIGCFIFGRFGDGIGLGMGALACAAVVVVMTKKLGAESLLR